MPHAPFVFDVDGTILDTNGCFWNGKATVASALMDLNPLLTEADLGPRIRTFDHKYREAHGASHHVFARLLSECYQTLALEYGLSASKDGIDRVRLAGEEVINWPCTPFPGALEALADIRHAGFPIGICTRGEDIEYQLKKLDRWGLRDLVDHVSVVRKKGPADIEAVVRALRPSGQIEGIMVGDSLVDDIASARAIGIQTVWIRLPDSPWLHDPHSPDGAGATWVVDSVSQIPDLLGIQRQSRAPSATRHR
jgi:phosphoglycolate phosphatase-like HAD superfamily hydrolase